MFSFSWNKIFFQEQNTKNALIQQGFSDNQGKTISWIVNYEHQGKLYGFLTGSFVAVTWGHYYKRFYPLVPLFRLRPSYKFPLQLLTVLGFIWGGNFIYTSRRHGANQLVANILRLNNNLYIKNKEDFIQSFEVLNRLFTPEQISRFNEKRVQIAGKHKRKWIFNQNIETQEQFKQRVFRFQNSLAPWKQSEILERINQTNSHKDRIIYEPWKPSIHFDETGEKHGLKYSINVAWAQI